MVVEMLGRVDPGVVEKRIATVGVGDAPAIEHLLAAADMPGRAGRLAVAGRSVTTEATTGRRTTGPTAVRMPGRTREETGCGFVRSTI